MSVVVTTVYHRRQGTFPSRLGDTRLRGTSRAWFPSSPSLLTISSNSNFSGYAVPEPLMSRITGYTR